MTSITFTPNPLAPLKSGVQAQVYDMTELTFWTYIITNNKLGTLYTGHTDDMSNRMQQHVRGELEGFSKKYKLKHLVWFETFGSREEAFQRERRIKEWNRQWKINLIEEINPHWIDINTVPYWPLPDRVTMPDQYEECLNHRLDPAMRRDERNRR